VAIVSGVEVNAGQWPMAKSELEASITFFNQTHRAVPHPGFEARFNFCPRCGATVDPAVFEQAVPAFDGVPKIYLPYAR